MSDTWRKKTSPKKTIKMVVERERQNMRKTKTPLISEKEFHEIQDFMKEEIFMVPVRDEDPNVCPTCGLDLENEDHAICQRFHGTCGDECF